MALSHLPRAQILRIALRIQTATAIQMLLIKHGYRRSLEMMAFRRCQRHLKLMIVLIGIATCTYTRHPIIALHVPRTITF